MDFKYRSEYAKSNRSSCKGCKSGIEQGTLRLAVLVQNPKFDGKTPNWYHQNCFFKKQRPKSVDDIEHYEKLRLPDQQKIQEQIGSNGVDVIVPTKKGKKRTAEEASAVKSALKDFTIQYSKSSRATCRGCELKIMKDEIRISKKDFDTEVGMKYGGQDMWHHVNCFAKLRSELGYYESADKLPGFKGLNSKDQTEVKKQLPAIKQEDIPDIKKIKNGDDEVDAASKKKQKEYEKQIKIIYKYRDQLQDELSKTELTTLLQTNNQLVPVGIDAILDHVADLMTCGSLPTCETCKGNFVFSKLGYVCQGDLSQWTKCSHIERDPKRVPFVIPSELKQKYNFLKKYTSKPCTRILKDLKPAAAPVKKEDEVDHKPKVEREKPPLYEMEFVILGKTTKGKDEIKKQIVSNGGKVVTKIKNTVMAVISTEAEVEKMGARMCEAETEQIHVVSEDFLDEVTKNVGKIPDLIVKKSICNWGSDPTKRLPVEPTTSHKSKSRSMYTKSVPEKIKLKLKGGTAVDPDSGLDDCAHVYVQGQDKYSVVLGITDIKANKNSYYKLQVLEADKGNKYWLFRSWGRIGTTIGDTKLENKCSLYDAIEAFKQLYLDKTGNHFEDRNVFEKKPGLLYPIDVDYGEDEAVQKMDIVESESKLHKSVQDLIRMIFDVNSMKKLMLEFELDTEKMPLGKISKSQVQNAYKVLTTLQNLIRDGANENAFIDASNRFYTFIPHSFGVDTVPVINTEEMVKQKIEMLDNLMELEIAYNLMKSSGSEHTVDSYYNQLNTEIEVLDRKTEEFELISEYVKNTHAATHSNYKLVIEDVFKVTRQGEYKRYKPFKKLHNKKLLWHGSRRTNFAGILSQGLRIAPPEAPVTGYMFGKGIYFADMVSKSANYCCTNTIDSQGLMLLCEVALGNMYERNQAEYVEKLPKGKHSTKGLGRTEPDPKQAKVVDDVEIPIGKGIQLPGRTNSSLLYNEYIVYDVAQVNVKYLLKLDFKYKF